jgi:hypothetical protein
MLVPSENPYQSCSQLQKNAAPQRRDVCCTTAPALAYNRAVGL